MFQDANTVPLIGVWLPRLTLLASPFSLLRRHRHTTPPVVLGFLALRGDLTSLNILMSSFGYDRIRSHSRP